MQSEAVNNTNMQEKIILYNYESPNIKISMELYFNEAGQLIFDGYDAGKTVKKLKKSYDYEYFYIIAPTELPELAALFDLTENDNASLLAALQSRFSGADAYFRFGIFLREHGIEFSTFSSK